MTILTPLASPDDAAAALAAPVMLLFKHSTRCPISSAAHAAVRDFLAAHPAVPARLVDVIAHRAVSQFIAEQTGISHQSPQALLLERGAVVWHASHWDITRSALEVYVLPRVK